MVTVSCVFVSTAFALEAAAEAYGKSVYGGHLKQVAAGAINSRNIDY